MKSGEPLKDGNSVSAAHVVGNLRRKALVVHKEEFEFPNVANEELFEAVGKEMTGLLVAPISDLAQGMKKDRPIESKERTEGIGSCPLNRRRTRLSIPFGFLHASLTLL